MFFSEIILGVMDWNEPHLVSGWRALKGLP